MSCSQFPKKTNLSFDVLVEYAAHDYGALATALHDESLINFDYV
jgi:hypothetical protein